MSARPALGLVVIGTSWGGLDALGIVLGSLPKSFQLPIVVVQHRTPRPKVRALAELLSARAQRPVTEAEDKSPLVRGHVHLAPSDYHLLVEGPSLALSVDEQVRFSRPSIDVLFESASESWGSHVCGVILTGANSDGADGLRAIYRCGGPTVVEDPQTAEQSTMPWAALEAVPKARVLPLREIGPYLSRLAKADGG